jgi:hypothetical protein
MLNNNRINTVFLALPGPRRGRSWPFQVSIGKVDSTRGQKDDGDTGTTFLCSPLLSFGWKPSRWCAWAMNVCWKSRPSLSFGRSETAHMR